MRALVLIGAVVVLGGCVELYQGPRMVHYNQDWFYIRHAPLVDGRGAVDRLAAEQCPASRPVQLVDVAQYYPFDLRDATYRCQRDTSTSPASPEPDPAPDPAPPAEG